MKSRHRAREVALQILYRYDVPQQAGAGTAPRDSALLHDLVRHFDHFQIPEGLREFATQLVAGTLANMAELDGILEQHVSNWKVARLGFVDRSLLRMAAYELKYLRETPASVVIDEAIELGKEFGTEDTPSFVNGVLDALKKHLG
jgi:N utilization substance protein B